MSNTQDFNKNNTDNTDNTDGIAGRDPVRALRYWLRAVDALTAREVQARFAEAGASRRDLRVLNLLSSEREIPERLSARLERGGKRLWSLADRGWIARADAADNTAASMGWKLTEAGELAQANLTRIVQEVRDRVSGAVTADDFETTVASLEAMARELGWAEGMRLPRSGRGRGSGHRRQGYQNGHGHGHRHGHRHGHGHDRHQSHHHGHDHRQGYHNGHDHPQEREHCSGRGYSRGQGHSHPYDRGRGVAQEHGAWRDCGHGRGSNRGFDSGYYGGDHGGDHGGHRGGHRGGRGERSVAFERGFAAGFAAGRPQA